MDSSSKIALVAYVASPHDGYLRLFRKYPNANLFVFGKKLISEFPSLTRHLPGNDPEDAARMIAALGVVRSVHILEPEDLGAVSAASTIIMPDEDVAHAFAAKYLPGTKIDFDGSWRLRWDMKATQSTQPSGEDVSVSVDLLDQALLREAQAAAQGSPDWWRQVGALMARDGKPILTAFNRHLPSDQTLYVLGDPRANFNAGERIDVSSALHAEIGIIAAAAQLGMTTEGADLYVSTFTCPPCAGAVAAAGFRRLYYAGGYSLLHGADALRSKGVEIIRVEL